MTKKHVVPVLQGKANMACDLNAVGTKLCGTLVSWEEECFQALTAHVDMNSSFRG